MGYMAKKTTLNVKLNLRDLLDKRGLKADDVVKLCEDAGYPITRATVYNQLSPHAQAIRMSSITALCAGLNVRPCELFKVEHVVD
jgi:DNA-binding Xre family transcriptional regulator